MSEAPQSGSGGNSLVSCSDVLKDTGRRFVVVQPVVRLHGSITQQPTNLEVDLEPQAYHLESLGQVGLKYWVARRRKSRSRSMPGKCCSVVGVGEREAGCND